ncbi:MAG: T9SS type A sorting domain-containing protein, partial [Duncaniella sp.]|nr:T9SS type A sorting domain-containing protein [Duncaniella sp.]
TYMYVTAPDGQLSDLAIDKVGIFATNDANLATPLTEIDATASYTIGADLKNTGAEYLGTVYPYLYDNWGHEVKLQAVTVDIPAGESGQVRWINQSLADQLYETEYTLTLCDKYGTQIGDGMKVNVTNGKSLTDLAIVKKINFVTDLGNYYENGKLVAPRVGYTFKASVEFEGISDSYSKTVYPYFYDASGKLIERDKYSAITLDLTKGQTFTYEALTNKTAMGLDEKQLPYNSLYQLSFAPDGGTKLKFENGDDFVWIYVTDQASGIETIVEDNTVCSVTPNPAESVATVTANGAISEIAVYSMNGALVLDRRYDSSNTAEQLDVTALPAGNYVLRVVADGKNNIARLIKR